MELATAATPRLPTLRQLPRVHSHGHPCTHCCFGIACTHFFSSSWPNSSFPLVLLAHHSKVAYRIKAGEQIMRGAEDDAANLVDNLQISAGLRYLKSEVGDEAGGFPVDTRTARIQSLVAIYRARLDAVKAGNNTSVITNTQTTSNAATTAANTKKPTTLHDLPSEIRNELYKYYAKDTDNLPADDIEIGRTVSGKYVFPKRAVSFNLNILLVSRMLRREAMAFITDELSTRRFLLTNYDGGVL
jgi:hypothetical protein